MTHEPSVGFDFREIDVRAGLEHEEENIVSRLVEFQGEILRAINHANGAKAKEREIKKQIALVRAAPPGPDALFKNHRRFLLRVLLWINRANSPLAKCVRLQASKLFLTEQRNQTRLGKEIGVGKAAISRQAVIFAKHFKFTPELSKAFRLRSDATRERLAEICKQRHAEKIKHGK